MTMINNSVGHCLDPRIMLCSIFLVGALNAFLFKTLIIVFERDNVNDN